MASVLIYGLATLLAAALASWLTDRRVRALFAARESQTRPRVAAHSDAAESIPAAVLSVDQRPLAAASLDTASSMLGARNVDALLEVVQAEVMTFDLAEKRTVCSAAFIKQLGFPDGCSDLSMADLAKVMHPADHAEMSKKIGMAISKCWPYTHDYRIVLPSGDTRWIRSYGKPVPDASGVVSTVQVIAIDVTELKRLE